jgi:hypothetical protein
MKEIDIQKQILDYLALKRVFHYRQNSGGLGGEHKGKKWFVRFGALGAPDIICVIKGQYVGIEIKNEKGKQSDHQRVFQQKLEKAGGFYLLARSLEDVINLIEHKEDRRQVIKLEADELTLSKLRIHPPDPFKNSFNGHNLSFWQNRKMCAALVIKVGD